MIDLSRSTLMSIAMLNNVRKLARRIVRSQSRRLTILDEDNE